MKPLPPDGLRAAVLAAVADSLRIDPRHVQRLVAKYQVVVVPSAIPPGGLKAAVREVQERVEANALIAAIKETGSISAAARKLDISRAFAQMIVRRLDETTIADARRAHRRRLADAPRAPAPTPAATTDRRIAQIDARLAKLDAIAAWRAARPKPPRRPRLEAEAAMKAERAEIKAEAQEREALIRERERLTSSQSVTVAAVPRDSARSDDPRPDPTRPDPPPLPSRRRWITLAEAQARARARDEQREREQIDAARVHIGELAKARVYSGRGAR